MALNRRNFLRATLAGAAVAAGSSAFAACGGKAASTEGCPAEKGSCPNSKAELKISFQEGIAPGANLNEKFDLMEKLGVVGFEPGGRGLKDRVKEIKEADTYEELDHVAKTLVDMLNVEAMSQVRVSYGNIIHEIKDVSRSYKEAKMALEVGKIFYADKIIVPYNNLGIGRLIYQLPIPLCQMFMKEVFGEQLPDTFDEETLTTINKFFENNLNVSETSRQLYVHRNTLVYRLEKLQKSTGLDIRVFDDALTFKIAMMVVSYMKYMETQD